MINNWAFQWKMSFNPDLAEQALEELFSHEKKSTSSYFSV